MYKKIFLIMIFSFFLIGMIYTNLVRASQFKLSYVPISNNSDGEIFTMNAKLKITNISEASITNVVVSVYNATNIEINSTPVLFDTINGGESKTSQESFIMIRSATQDNINTEITWQIQYVDSNGDDIVEFVSMN